MSMSWNHIRSALPPDLKHHPSEYVMSGRFDQSIAVSEGEKITNMVADIVGEHVRCAGSTHLRGLQSGTASAAQFRCRFMTCAVIAAVDA